MPVSGAAPEEGILHRRTGTVKRLLLLTAAAVLVLGGLIISFPVGAEHPSPAQPPLGPSGDSSTWVGSWGSAAHADSGADGTPGTTIRNLVHTSVGGDRVRVRLSNVFGVEPLTVQHTTVGIQREAGTAAIAPDTLHDVTFDGDTDVIIPAGAEISSDPVELPLDAASDLFVTTFTPDPALPATSHTVGLSTSYYATDGEDRAASLDGRDLAETTTSWHYVTEVDVEPGRSPGAVVTLGDSITDGVGSGHDMNRRYPDFLAERLRAEGGRFARMGVINAGISGNKVLLDGAGEAATERLQRDVLDRAGASSVIILLGINDIQAQPQQLDPDKIIAGLEQIASESRAAGLRVVGGTMTPFKGWGAYGAEQEATRQAVNDWIRSSDSFDAVADFDRAIRDPSDPQQMLPAYDSGDHLHPSEAGYEAMAAAVELSELAPAEPPRTGDPGDRNGRSLLRVHPRHRTAAGAR